MRVWFARVAQLLVPLVGPAADVRKGIIVQ